MSTPAGSVPPLDWPHYGIGFIPAVKRAFKKYATFTGRASRSEFWWWFLANAIIGTILYILFFAVGLATVNRETGQFGAGGIVVGVIFVLYALAIVVPNIAVTVRRLHDAGFSGWFYLFTIVGLGIIPLIMCVLETSPKAVEYGPPAPTGYAPGGYGNTSGPGYAPPPGTPTA